MSYMQHRRNRANSREADLHWQQQEQHAAAAAAPVQQQPCSWVANRDPHNERESERESEREREIEIDR